MAISSLTYIAGSSVKCFFQMISVPEHMSSLQ